MKTYKVTATMETDLVLIIEAESREEAMELAADQPENFTEDGWASGDFRIDDAYEVEDDD